MSDDSTELEQTIIDDAPPKGRKGPVHRTFRSFVLSRKLWMTLLSLGLLCLIGWKLISFLFVFGTYTADIATILVPAFTGLARDIMVCFTAIIGSYLGIQGLVQWRHGSESIVNQAASFVSEKIDKKEEITKNINYSAHIIEEGAEGAPENRPFSQLAVHPDGYDE